MKREPIYMDEHIYLEKIQLPIAKGVTKKWVWRQVTNINGELEVKESNNEPEWYTRHIKLNELLK